MTDLGTYSANSNSMTGGAADLGTLSKRMDAEVDEVERMAVRLLQEDWKGNAPAQYAVVQAKWNAAFQEMGRLTLGSSNVMIDAHDAMFGADRNSAARWGSAG